MSLYIAHAENDFGFVLNESRWVRPCRNDSGEMVPYDDQGAWNIDLGDAWIHLGEVFRKSYPLWYRGWVNGGGNGVAQRAVFEAFRTDPPTTFEEARATVRETIDRWFGGELDLPDSVSDLRKSRYNVILPVDGELQMRKIAPDGSDFHPPEENLTVDLPPDLDANDVTEFIEEYWEAMKRPASSKDEWRVRNLRQAARFAEQVAPRSEACSDIIEIGTVMLEDGEPVLGGMMGPAEAFASSPASTILQEMQGGDFEPLWQRERHRQLAGLEPVAA